MRVFICEHFNSYTAKSEGEFIMKIAFGEIEPYQIEYYNKKGIDTLRTHFKRMEYTKQGDLSYSENSPLHTINGVTQNEYRFFRIREIKVRNTCYGN